jgi:hypothetical protein
MCVGSAIIQHQSFKLTEVHTCTLKLSVDLLTSIVLNPTENKYDNVLMTIIIIIIMMMIVKIKLRLQRYYQDLILNKYIMKIYFLVNLLILIQHCNVHIFFSKLSQTRNF